MDQKTVYNRKVRKELVIGMSKKMCKNKNSDIKINL